MTMQANLGDVRGLDILEQIAGTGGVRCALRTDGEGRVTSLRGQAPADKQALALRIDVALAAAANTGAALGLGALNVVMMDFAGGFIVAARTPGGEHWAALAEHETNPGLILTRLKRLVSQGQAAADDHPRE